jgi:hypothetical protein
MVIVTGVNFFPLFFFSIVCHAQPFLISVTHFPGVRDDGDLRSVNFFPPLLFSA